VVAEQRLIVLGPKPEPESESSGHARWDIEGGAMSHRAAVSLTLSYFAFALAASQSACDISL
jgi:hypothetical protein